MSNQELAQLIGQRDSQHPSSDELAALVDQSLPASRREALFEHLERCTQCARAVAITVEPTSELATPIASAWLPRAMAAVIAVTGIALAAVLFISDKRDDDVLRTVDAGLSPLPGAQLTSTAAQFNWPRPDDLSVRRVRLMNESATTLWLSELGQPPMAMPAEHLPSKATLLWQLEDASGTVTAGPHWFRVR